MLSLFPRTQPAPRLEEHYGLAHRPFALTLDQHFVYHSRAYAAALADVRRALDRRDGLVVVTGDTGTGKTMLCRTLVQQLDSAACVSVVLDPRVTSEDLLRHMLADFGVIVSSHGPPPSRHQLMRALQRFLASLAPAGGCAVLVVDEAQRLNADVLEQLCLLLNLETNESKLLQVVLVGHTSLTEVLGRAELGQLNQRVARRCTLAPLESAEVKGYIQHRLATAQRLALAADIRTLQDGEAAIETVPCNLSFRPSAIRVIVRESRGIPRLVNLLCDRALEIGCERRTHTIRAPIVRAAARRLAGRASAAARGRALVRAVAAVAALAVAAAGAGAGAWQAGGAQSSPRLPPPPPAFAAAAWSGRPGEVGRIEVFDRLEIWNGSLSVDPKGEAPSADPRLLGVALLRKGDLVSLALELSAEPRRAVLHTVSDRMLELEMGPVAGPVRAEQLAPASEVPLVSQLSIREQRAPGIGIFVRARVMLRAPGRGDVRVAGRVVYVDLQPAGGNRQDSW